MSQLQELQDKLGERARWFRVGVLSATALTPLVTRWQGLRAALRTQAMRETRRAGPSWPWTNAQTRTADGSRPQGTNGQVALWLMGVGIGLVAAGTGAYLIARRRMRLVEDQPVDLPLPSPDGQESDATRRGRDWRRRRAYRTAESVTGPDTEHLPGEHASSIAASVDPMTPAGSRNGGTSAFAFGDAPPTPTAASTLSRDRMPDDETVEPAPIVGNLRTLVYYEADAPNLPPEELRVYFASAVAAQAAGYRAVVDGDAHDEAPAR